MKALIIPHFAEKIVASAILFSLIFWIYPEISLANNAQSVGQPALVFEIKNPADLQNQNSISFEQLALNDPLVAKVEAYLESKGSPLSVYAAQIVQQPQWQRALGVSFVESNLGKFCYDNNCSGIGVKPGHPSWRKYNTKLDWFIDLNDLLEKPIYKERYNTFQKMKGVYVQPGSQRWVNGAQKVYNELMKLTEEATVQRQQLAANYSRVVNNALSKPVELAQLD